MGQEHKKRNGSTPLFSTPPRIPTEVNLLILITVKDKLEKMQTPVFKGYNEWRTQVESPDVVLNQYSLGLVDNTSL